MFLLAQKLLYVIALQKYCLKGCVSQPVPTIWVKWIDFGGQYDRQNHHDNTQTLRPYGELMTTQTFSTTPFWISARSISANKLLRFTSTIPRTSKVYCNCCYCTVKMETVAYQKFIYKFIQSEKHLGTFTILSGSCESATVDMMDQQEAKSILNEPIYTIQVISMLISLIVL